MSTREHERSGWALRTAFSKVDQQSGNTKLFLVIDYLFIVGPLKETNALQQQQIAGSQQTIANASAAS